MGSRISPVGDTIAIDVQVTPKAEDGPTGKGQLGLSGVKKPKNIYHPLGKSQCPGALQPGQHREGFGDHLFDGGLQGQRAGTGKPVQIGEHH